MKAYEIDTGSYHKVISLDYDTNTVVMESKEGDRVKTTIDKVRLSTNKDEDLKGKNIIYPQWFWIIPFIGWFMVPYKLFTIKDCVILNENFKHDVIMTLAGFSPFLLMLFLFYFTL